MPSVFDVVIDRANTDSVKFDARKAHNVPADALPMWVADMDFLSPRPVLDVLMDRCRHGVFGYCEPNKGYYNAVQSWFYTRFGWDVQDDWITITPGIVTAVCLAIRAFTAAGDAVLIQPPVYYPFAASILANNRRVATNELVYRDGAYSIDFDDFEAKIKDCNVKLFILCSPHNPVGRVWTEAELRRMGEICLRHGVLVISDEIHMDFVYGGHKHRVFAALDKRFLNNCITCTAPSKTFNLAGLQLSNIFIKDPKLREAFQLEAARTNVDMPSLMGVAACRAAYEKGSPWLTDLLRYLDGNFGYLRDYLADNLPQLRLVEPEGTYLAWLDCTGLGMRSAERDAFMLNKAKLWLDNGPMFGEGGESFERINIACPRSTLEKAMEQLKAAVHAL